MKKLMAAVLAAMMVLSLSACSSNSDQGESSSSTASQNNSSSSQASEVTADSLAQKMVEATTFNDEVIAISADVVPNYYTIPDSVEDYAVYMCPTGATVEEISVFRTSDAAAVEEMIQTHLDARKTEYESYRPDEVKKLDGAAVVKSGDYVAVIIADDTAAAEAAFEAELGA